MSAEDVGEAISAGKADGSGDLGTTTTGSTTVPDARGDALGDRLKKSAIDLLADAAIDIAADAAGFDADMDTSGEGADVSAVM
jgi:glycosyltransferase A (GT-A) superfamily protein (DUF2064 family)